MKRSVITRIEMLNYLIGIPQGHPCARSERCQCRQEGFWSASQSIEFM